MDMTPEQDRDARQRQAAKVLRMSLEQIRNLRRSFGPLSPNDPVPWTVDRLEQIRNTVLRAHELLTEQVDTQDLLDELADL